MITPYFRGIIVGITITLISLATIVSAAPSGGLFGDILAKMLGISPAAVLTYSGDGTVANAKNLGGLPAANYQRATPNQSCPLNQCIYGFDAGGTLLCR